MDKLEDFEDQVNRLLAGLVFATQSAFLDYYLIYHLGNLWFLWILADLVVVGVMLYAFVVTYLYKRGHFNRFLPYPCPGDLPLAYSVWIFYSITLAVRCGVLFKNVASKLTETTLFGPNLLQVSVALAVPFTYFLIKSVSLRKPGPMKHSTELLLFCEEVLNILDGVDILSVLISSANTAKLATGLVDAAIAFGCLAFVIPTINLATYSITKYEDKVGMSRIIRAVYVLTALFLINLPLFVLRLVMWNSSGIVTSLFVTKNAIFIIVHFLDIISIIIAQQPSQYQVDEKRNIPMYDNALMRQPEVVRPQDSGDARKPPRPEPAQPEPNNRQNRRRPLPPASPNEETPDVEA